MNRMKLLRFWKLWKTETPLSRSVRPPFVSFGNRFVAYPSRNFLNKEQIVRIIRLRMARGKKYQKVIGISDLRRMELSMKEAAKSSNSHTRDESDDGDVEHDESDDGDGEDDDTSLSDSVVRLLKEKRDIGHLTLQVYRAYLRNHDLRISGNKAECLMRIHEHWRIKKSSGKALYPSSSFTIDCTGDVCKGDVVQFKQIVYGYLTYDFLRRSFIPKSYNFTKIPRPAKVLGVRTVAGRVVNESYGAAKQQHTFTVEVLWTKGRKRLPPLFPLRVKGRNLYRIKTLRQNEDERSKALSEKHTRGAIAKQDRSIQVQLQEMRDSGQSSDKVYKKQHSISNQPGKASANPVTRAFASRCDGKIASTSVSYPNATYQQFCGMQMQSDCRSALFAFYRGNVPSVVHK